MHILHISLKMFCFSLRCLYHTYYLTANEEILLKIEETNKTNETGSTIGINVGTLFSLAFIYFHSNAAARNQK